MLPGTDHGRKGRTTVRVVLFFDTGVFAAVSCSYGIDNTIPYLSSNPVSPRRPISSQTQIPKHEPSDVPHDASPKPYVYVSSSESETCSPPLSPSSLPPPSPAANGVGEGGTSSSTPAHLSRGASVHFPSAQENDPAECVGGSVEGTDNSPTVMSPSLAEGTARDEGVEGDSNTPAVGEPDPQTTLSNEELVRRVHELEAELKALRMSAAAAAEAAAKTVAAATAAAATAATMGSSTQDIEAESTHAHET